MYPQTEEIVYIETCEFEFEDALPVLAGLATDPSALTYEELVAAALAADATAAEWLTHDINPPQRKGLYDGLPFHQQDAFDRWMEDQNGEAIRGENIVCPECETIQSAWVTWNESDPWPSYVHTCKQCGYIILESEWQHAG